MDELLHMTTDRALRYLAGRGEREVAPAPEVVARLGALDGPLPDAPDDPGAVIALLDEIGSPATVASAGPRFFGFVVGGALPVTLAANWLAGAWDQEAGQVVASPTAAALEAVAQRWLLDLLGLPPTCASPARSGLRDPPGAPHGSCKVRSGRQPRQPHAVWAWRPAPPRR